MSAAVALLGIDVSRLGLDSALRACSVRIAARLGGYACFVNAHSLTESTHDPALRDALQHATYCFADGVPLVWLARLKHAAIESRVCGPDFMAALLARESARTHGFIGGAPGHADAIAARFGVAAVTHVPPVRAFSIDVAHDDWRRFLDACPDREPPPIVWIGLGAPKQERWLRTVSAIAPGVMFFGVGAAFDFLSGSTPRAPHVLQRAGLEWAHRLTTEPRRLWRRYLVTNSRFVALAVRELVA